MKLVFVWFGFCRVFVVLKVLLTEELKVLMNLERGVSEWLIIVESYLDVAR